MWSSYISSQSFAWLQLWILTAVHLSECLGETRVAVGAAVRVSWARKLQVWPARPWWLCKGVSQSTPNFCAGVCSLQIAAPGCSMCLITRRPLKLPSGTKPINYFDWSVKCPEEIGKHWLVQEHLGESQYTRVAFLLVCPAWFYWHLFEKLYTEEILS